MPIETINVQFSQFIKNLLDYAILLAASGTLAMALLEAVKGLWSAKARFHKKALKIWVSSRYTEAKSSALEHVENRLEEILSDNPQIIRFQSTALAESRDSEEESWLETAFGQLESLCNGLDTKAPVKPTPGFQITDELAFYSLNTEQVIAKVQRSLESVIQHPARSPLLFLMLASQHIHSAEEWLEYLEKENSDDHEITAADRKDALHYQGVLVELLNNKLDSLQINILYAWGRKNRFMSMMLGAAILFVFFMIYFPEMHWFKVILFSSLGGMVSPVCKNLVTAIKGISMK